MANVQKNQWLCFLQPSLTEIHFMFAGWKEAGDILYFIFIYLFSNNILQMLAENQQGNKRN